MFSSAAAKLQSHQDFSIPAGQTHQSSSPQHSIGADTLDGLADTANRLSEERIALHAQTLPLISAFDAIKKDVATNRGGDWSKLTRQDTDAINAALAPLPPEARQAFIQVLAQTLSPCVSPFDLAKKPHPTSEELRQGIKQFANQWHTKFDSHTSFFGKAKDVIKTAAKTVKDHVAGKDSFDSAMAEIIENHCTNLETLRTAVNALFDKHGKDVFSEDLTDAKEISSKFPAIAMLATSLNPGKKIAADNAGNALLIDEQPSVPAVSLDDAAQTYPVNQELATLLKGGAQPRRSVVINVSEISEDAKAAKENLLTELTTQKFGQQRQSVVANDRNTMSIEITNAALLEDYPLHQP